MADSPYPERGPDRSALDRALLEKTAKDAASAARCAHRIEEAMHALATRLDAQSESVPPMRPKLQTFPHASPDDSQHTGSVNVEAAIERAEEKRELDKMKKRRDWALGVIQLGGGAAVGVFLWEVAKWIFRIAHQ